MWGMLVSRHAAWAGTSVAKRLLLGNLQSCCPHTVDAWCQLLLTACFLSQVVSCIVEAAAFYLGSKGGVLWVPNPPSLTRRATFSSLPPLEVGSLPLSAWNPPACLSRSISVRVGKRSLEISPLLHFTFMFYSGSQVFQFFPLEYSLQQRPCCSL